MQDPYDLQRTLSILHDPNDPARFRQPLERGRYARLLDDLLYGTRTAIASTLSLYEAVGIVQAAVTRRSITLDSVLLELREQVGHFPLTVLVHGWGSPAAGAFFSLIGPLLRRDDAVWMLPSHESESTTTPNAAAEGTVLLNLRYDTDQRIYKNLVGDILFFPALHKAEATQVATWQQRARVLIVDGRGGQRTAVLRAGQEASLMTYRWSGELALHQAT